MRAVDDGIARLDRDQALEEGRRSWVRGGQHGRHHAHRHGQFGNTQFRFFAQHADRLQRGDLLVQQVGVEQVLGDLVPYVSVAGLFDRHACQAFGVLPRRLRHGCDDGVHLLLAETLKRLEGSVGGLDLGAYLLNGTQIAIFQHRAWLVVRPLGQH